MKHNYQKELEKIISQLELAGETPRLLLHSCCAPCSSYVLEYLSEYFSITVFYYNPNITGKEEYHRRVEEQKRLIRELPVKHPISFVEGEYDPADFMEAVKGVEHIPEGGERCFRCFALRLSQTAALAEREHFDYFTTTLTISPLKNAEKLNEIGERAEAEYCGAGTKFLHSDFKKKNGYKRSTELSREYGLYRQDYCGCIFSKQEREQQKAQMAEQKQ